jgi:hypothetical protein
MRFFALQISAQDVNMIGFVHVHTDFGVGAQNSPAAKTKLFETALYGCFYAQLAD